MVIRSELLIYVCMFMVLIICVIMKFKTQTQKEQFMIQLKGLDLGSLQEIVRTKEKYSDLLERFNKLQSFISLDGDVHMELDALQETIENIKSNLQDVEVTKQYGGDSKVINL